MRSSVLFNEDGYAIREYRPTFGSEGLRKDEAGPHDDVSCIATTATSTKEPGLAIQRELQKFQFDSELTDLERTLFWLTLHNDQKKSEESHFLQKKKQKRSH